MANKPVKKAPDFSVFKGMKATGALDLPKDAPASKPVAKDAPAKQPRKARKAPWESDDIVPGRKTKLLVRISEEDHAMLMYIKQRTGASAAFSLLSEAMPALRKQAKSLFKDEE